MTANKFDLSSGKEFKEFFYCFGIPFEGFVHGMLRCVCVCKIPIVRTGESINMTGYTSHIR
jgi:hypothetical protein